MMGVGGGDARASTLIFASHGRAPCGYLVAILRAHWQMSPTALSAGGRVRGTAWCCRSWAEAPATGCWTCRMLLEAWWQARCGMDGDLDERWSASRASARVIRGQGSRCRLDKGKAAANEPAVAPTSPRATASGPVRLEGEIAQGARERTTDCSAGDAGRAPNKGGWPWERGVGADGRPASDVIAGGCQRVQGTRGRERARVALWRACARNATDSVGKR